jgi:hypothetical protein
MIINDLHITVNETSNACFSYNNPNLPVQVFNVKSLSIDLKIHHFLCYEGDNGFDISDKLVYYIDRYDDGKSLITISIHSYLSWPCYGVYPSSTHCISVKVKDESTSFDADKFACSFRMFIADMPYQEGDVNIANLPCAPVPYYMEGKTYQIKDDLIYSEYERVNNKDVVEGEEDSIVNISSSIEEYAEFEQIGEILL